MAWTNPRTWVAGEFVTAALLNAHIRDNLNAAFPLAVNAWTAWTPTLTQSGTVTKTVTYAKYQRVGRLIVASFDLTATAAGSAGTRVEVGLPVAGAASALHVGNMLVYDTSTTTRYNGNAEMVTTTAVALSYNTASALLWGASPSVALASGDIIRGTVTYEAAS